MPGKRPLDFPGDDGADPRLGRAVRLPPRLASSCKGWSDARLRLVYYSLLPVARTPRSAARLQPNVENTATMLRAEINGLAVAYRRVGHGPAIVMLHGFTQDSRVWRPQLDALSDRFTLIAWDAPGAGQSSDPAADFAIGRWADTLAGLLDAAGIPRAHVLGLSWGGLLAQEFYRKYPARVSSLILADTYAGWKGSLSDAIAQERLAACVRDSALPPSDFIPRYLPGMFSDAPPPGVKEELAEIMAGTHPLGFRVMAKALAENDTRDLLTTILVPTLLVWGEADKRSPMNIAHQLEQAISGAKLAVIPGAGHVSNMEAPAAFNSIVREFCLANEHEAG